MKKVTKEEFDILSKFFPSEIRYYVEVPETAKKKKRSDAGKRRRSTPGVISRFNRPLMLGPNASSYQAQTPNAQKALMCIRLQFANEPTRIIGQTDLRDKLLTQTSLPNNYIQPFISDCIHRLKVLKIKT